MKLALEMLEQITGEENEKLIANGNLTFGRDKEKRGFIPQA